MSKDLKSKHGGRPGTTKPANTSPTSSNLMGLISRLRKLDTNKSHRDSFSSDISISPDTTKLFSHACPSGSNSSQFSSIKSQISSIKSQIPNHSNDHDHDFQIREKGKQTSVDFFLPTDKNDSRSDSSTPSSGRTSNTNDQCIKKSRSKLNRSVNAASPNKSSPISSINNNSPNSKTSIHSKNSSAHISHNRDHKRNIDYNTCFEDSGIENDSVQSRSILSNETPHAIVHSYSENVSMPSSHQYIDKKHHIQINDAAKKGFGAMDWPKNLISNVHSRSNSNDEISLEAQIDYLISKQHISHNSSPSSSNQNQRRHSINWDGGAELNQITHVLSVSNTQEVQAIVHAQDDVLKVPIRDVTICPVHGTYVYNNNQSSDIDNKDNNGDDGHSYVNALDSSCGSSEKDFNKNHLSKKNVSFNEKQKLNDKSGRTLKGSDFESDLESISGVSATSQEVATITSVLRRRRVQRSKNKHKQGRSTSHPGYIDMRGSKKGSRPNSQQNGVQKSLASFAEQSILSFLSTWESNPDDLSSDASGIYEHSTREFKHESPGLSENADEYLEMTNQKELTPTNDKNKNQKIEINHPTLHDIVSSHDLLAITLGKSGYTGKSFGINVTWSTFTEKSTTPTNFDDTPCNIRGTNRKIGSAFSPTFHSENDIPLVLIAVESIDKASCALFDGRIHPGDYLIEINGKIVISKTDKEVKRLMESEDVLNLVIARSRHELSRIDENS